ncbi:hypothetical protein R1sor_022198 [Riccia sorocarpa]|uniref:SSD domain-containing protein n=1 Tax=Riccia sorocarpa TaxID=122646 RepID=A0ABD3GL41_9MARC
MGLHDSFRKAVGRYHLWMNNAFSAYGSYVARKPHVPFIFGMLLLGGFCFGLFNYHKEIDLEKLWVEHGSRVVEEKEFFNSRFGGIPRQETAAIVSKGNPDAQLKLTHAMDALTYAVGPLFDNISLSYTPPGRTKPVILTQGDLCVRPLVPPTLRPGNSPLLQNNWLSWGFQKLSTCAVNATFAGSGVTPFTLPVGWGISKFPCTKLLPHDCFREGGDFDYPEALRQLESPMPPLPTGNFTLIDITATFVSQSNVCTVALTSEVQNMVTLTGLPSEQVAPLITQIVEGVLKQTATFFSWGYRWRRSYKGMSDKEIINYINSAMTLGKEWNQPPTNPQVQACILQQLPCCLTWFGLHSPILAAFGSIDYNDGGNVTKIGGLRWGQNNYHEAQPLWKDYIEDKLGVNLTQKERKNLHKAWEAVMVNHLLPLRNRGKTLFSSTYKDLQLEFLTWRSTQDIISDSAKTPIWQIILSVILTSLYAFLAFVNFKRPVHSHTWVTLTGLAVVTLAILSGFGFSAMIGIKFSPLAGGVVPFLALGLGIDDVFVLVNIMRNYLEDPRLQAMGAGSVVPEREMRLTLALAGPSVILTTFSVLAAFFISSLNPMPISQWFCWQMGITASLHTLGLLLIFMPIMAIDARRVKARINDPNLWLIHGVRSKVTPSAAAEAKENEVTEEPAVPFDVNDPSFGENTGSTAVSRWVAAKYAPLFKDNIFKVTVVLLSAVFLAIMIFLGFHKVEHGLKLSDVTLSGSYQNTFAKLTEERFPNYDVAVVTREIDYPNRQNQMLEIFSELQKKTRWVPKQPTILESSWLGGLYLYSNRSANVSYPLPPALFNQLAAGWSTSSLGIFSLQDVYCEHSGTNLPVSCFNVGSDPSVRIKASKSAMFAQNLGASTEPNLDMIRETRKVVDRLNEKFGEKVAFMYGYPFLFYEQYLHSYHDLYLVVGLALVGVFVAVTIFQFSLTVSILICLVLLITNLEVYGFLYIIGAKLNALSLVNLGIVIGMSAEFTYLARSFLIVEGSRNHRVGKALEWTFEPLLHGFGTQFVATFPLLFVKYHAFRLYYFAMFTIMGLIAFFNGFVLLPALLTWVGPDTLHHIKQASSQTQSQVANGSVTKGEPLNGSAPDGDQK